MTSLRERKIPEPSDALVREFIVAGGWQTLAPTNAPVERVQREGVVNHVRLVGDLCIRFLKDWDFASDVRTEVVAVPAARAAGVLTPEMLAHDFSGSRFPGLVTIYRRVRGRALGSHDEPPILREILRELADQITIWSGIEKVPDPSDWLDKFNPMDLWQIVCERRDRLPTNVVKWIEALARRLDTARPESPRFTHNDLHAHNLMVQDGHLSGVVDWGDAGFTDPVVDLTWLPADQLPEIVIVLPHVTPDFIGRVLRQTVAYATEQFDVPADDKMPSWPGPRHRWRDLQNLWQRTGLSTTWREWMGDAPPR